MELTTSGMMSLARVQMAPLHSESKQSRDPPQRGEEKSGVEFMGMMISRQDMELVKDFDEAWCRYVLKKSQADDLPKGKREHSIERLQNEILAERERNESVENELLAKIVMIQDQEVYLNHDHQSKMEREAEHQRSLHRKLTQFQNDVLDSYHLQDQTLPWFHFMEQLNVATVQRQKRIQEETKEQEKTRSEPSEDGGTSRNKQEQNLETGAVLTEEHANTQTNEQGGHQSSKPEDKKDEKTEKVEAEHNEENAKGTEEEQKASESIAKVDSKSKADDKQEEQREEEARTTEEDAQARVEQTPQEAELHDSEKEETSNVVDSQTLESNPVHSAMSPSERAMCLIEQAEGPVADMKIRAYHVDHVLLTTHVEMLKKEIERLEKTIRSNESTARFLTQNNVQQMFPAQDDGGNTARN